MISKKARILEQGLYIIGIRNIISRIMLSPKRKQRSEEPPKSFYRKYSVESRIIENRKCFTFKGTLNPRKHILYFHGGAYTMQAKRRHWHIVDRLLQKTQCDITFVNYPLVPEFKCLDTIDMTSKAYAYFCAAADQDMVLMGDSAGGGLALALALLIKQDDDLPKPVKLALLSPWLDVSMEIPTSIDLEKSDLILDKETLTTVGKRYAGDLNTNDPSCSPLYGNLRDIGEIALFTGTKDILHVQAKYLRDSLISNNQKVVYHKFENMQHAWIAFPIPEAEQALNLVASFINE